jgi:hypothetical protein
LGIDKNINERTNDSIMSSLFVHAENQKILWKTLNEIPSVYNMELSRRQTWFKSIIQHFHETEPPVSSKEELKQINRKLVCLVCDSFLPKLEETEPSPFGDSVKDEPLKNMEELVKQHLLERENEIGNPTIVTAFSNMTPPLPPRG